MEKMKMFYFLICMSMFTLLVGFVEEENKKGEEITQTLNSLNNSYTELKTILENNIEIKGTEDNEDFYVPTVKDKKELENTHEENNKIYVQVKTEYLNVRKEPNLSSKITDVLVKDYVVEATEELENGWLLLKQGGYINGKYVNKIEEQEAVKLIFQQNQKPKPQPKFTTVEKHKNQLISRSKSNNANKSIRLDVVAPSNASIEDLRKILDGTALEGIEHALLEVEDKFGINALFTLAVAKLESAHGKSKLARHKNNLFGMNAVDGSAYESAFSYSSKSESVYDFAERIRKYYIDRGLRDLPSINRKYSSNPEWSHKVASIMRSDALKIAYK